MNNDKPKAIISLFDLTGEMVKPWADAGKAGHKFEYAYDLNYDASGNVASLADQYRCARCGAIDTVE